MANSLRCGSQKKPAVARTSPVRVLCSPEDDEYDSSLETARWRRCRSSEVGGCAAPAARSVNGDGVASAPAVIWRRDRSNARRRGEEEEEFWVPSCAELRSVGGSPDFVELFYGSCYLYCSWIACGFDVEDGPAWFWPSSGKKMAVRRCRRRSLVE